VKRKTCAERWGFKRSEERMHKIEAKLRSGMTQNEIPREAQKEIITQITSFARYGFPESHAASFALIAYASAYLIRRHLVFGRGFQLETRWKLATYSS